ncbi:hypothetical protein BKA62DRAFT_695174 [Auriculariales sp. MPI-PUGE-AT-0066]|nr:hypothetical protein BKA62DRAFT_695174 [Auriculariales sp. MPI-PUGE-AT-0066]
MSVLRRLFSRSHSKVHAQDDSVCDPLGPVGNRSISARKAASLYSVPRRSRSVADGLVSLLIRERKSSAHTTLGAPVEFKARPRGASSQRSRANSFDSSTTQSSDIRCPSELGEQRNSLSSDVDDSPVAIFVKPPPHDPPAPSGWHLPAEILALIIQHVPPASLPTLARVNRMFYGEASRLIYYSVNLGSQSMSPGALSSKESGLSSLSASRELCRHVRVFRYALPRTVFSSNRGNGSPGAPVVNTTVDRLKRILAYMDNLRDLYLENAPLNILHGSRFELTTLHIECSTLATDEERDEDVAALGSWLSKQRALTSLHLVNCDSVSVPLTDAAECLPLLNDISGSAAIVSSLVPFRPVQRVRMTLSKSDESRTTPSRLMAALSRSAASVHALELELSASELPYDVYLQAAATRLRHLRTLSVSGSHRALELLFRHIHHILLPLTELHTVRMTTRPQVPHHHDTEFQRVKIWYKLCPSLRLLQFPSRVEWVVTVDSQALAPKVDKREPETGGLSRLRVISGNI